MKNLFDIQRAPATKTEIDAALLNAMCIQRAFRWASWPAFAVSIYIQWIAYHYALDHQWIGQDAFSKAIESRKLAEFFMLYCFSHFFTFFFLFLTFYAFWQQVDFYVKKLLPLEKEESGNLIKLCEKHPELELRRREVIAVRSFCNGDYEPMSTLAKELDIQKSDSERHAKHEADFERLHKL